MQVKVKSAVHINRPPQEVFDYLSNPDNMPVWQSTLHHVEEKRNLAGARLARNAVVHDRRNVLGKDIDSQYQVGFNWMRQYGFRVVKDFGGKFALGLAVEAPEATICGRGFSSGPWLEPYGQRTRSCLTS